MRKSLALAVVASSFSVFACGGGEPAPNAPPPAPTATTPVATATPSATTTATVEAPKMTMAEMQKKTLAAMTAAFSAHDAKKVGDAYATDAKSMTPSAEGWKETSGRDAIIKRQEDLFSKVDPTATNVRILSKGDVAVIEWVGSGTDKETKKKVAFRGATVTWFDESGLIKLAHVYVDEGTIGMQLGKIPGKARETTVPTADATWAFAKNDDAEAKVADAMKNGWPVNLPKKDRKAYEAGMTDDFVHEEIASPMDFKGKAEAMKEFDMLVKAFPDMSVTVDNNWAVGTVDAMEWTLKATHKGQFGPLKATNKPFTLHGLDILETKDGKMSKASSYTNSMELVAQLGLLPPKKDAPPKVAPPPPKDQLDKKK